MNQSVGFLLVLYSVLFFSFHSIVVVQAQEELCTRKSDDKTKAPDFICAYNVNVTRLSDSDSESDTSCRTQITESITFPNLIDISSWERNLYLTDGQRLNTSSVKVIPSTGAEVKVSANENGVIKFPMEESDEPLTFNLSYEVIGGVTRYGGGCDFDNDDDLDDENELSGDDSKKFSIIQWAVGKLQQTTIDSLSIRFSSDNETSKLRSGFKGNGTTDGNDFVFNVSNAKVVDKKMTYYVLDESETPCTLKGGCLSKKGPNILSGVILAIIAGLVVVLLCVTTFCYRRKKRQTNFENIPVTST